VLTFHLQRDHRAAAIGALVKLYRVARNARDAGSATGRHRAQSSALMSTCESPQLCCLVDVPSSNSDSIDTQSSAS